MGEIEQTNLPIIDFSAMVMYEMTDLQYQAVYNVLSFALASMMATTVYLWFRSFAVKAQYQSAVLISGLVTFIAAYHYMRIFNSWVDAYKYSPGSDAPTLTGVPFNDAYRYMDWLLTVPLLLMEILLVMELSDEEYSSKAWVLGFGSALMIVSGYYGELVITGDLTPRWLCWFLSMGFFLYIVYELLVGLPLPHVGNQRSNCCGFYSDWLLRIRHHFQVRRWPCDLSDLLCQVNQGGFLGLR